MPVCRVDLVTPADVVGHDRSAAGDAFSRAFDRWPEVDAMCSHDVQ